MKYKKLIRTILEVNVKFFIKTFKHKNYLNKISNILFKDIVLK